MKKSKKSKATLGRVLLALGAFTLTLSVAGTAVTNEWSGYINKFLNIESTQIVQGDSNEDPMHFKSDFSKYTDVMENARKVAKEAQAEGTVLMTNKNNALPLNKGAKVTFFSQNSVDLALGGTGSGGVSASAERKIDLVKACANDGKLQMNQTMYDYYQNAEKAKRKVGTIVEINASNFTEEAKASYNEYKDAAIFVLTRIGGEGSDLIKTNATAATASNAQKYLALNDDEKSVLEAMKNGPFSKRIVLVNTFNTPELGWLDEYNIDACLYIGGPGEVGLDAVTDILVGKTCPSGKLADTYAYDTFSSPAMQNFGDFTYSNTSEIVNKNAYKYLMYNEGIYVGYRYYETRYEDSVLGKGNATSTTGAWASNSAWNYAEEVQFPFGYGLSYTDFTQTLNGVDVNWGAKTATVTVTVENTGAVAGKDVVEVYAQAPYTAGGIEKSAIQLCGFAKTAELAPGKSEKVEITVDLADIASYDYKNAKTYVLEKGDYYFSIGNGVHEALNNVLVAKGADASKMVGKGDAKKAVKATKNDFNATEYSLSATNRKITNQFEMTDLNYYVGGTDQEVKYLSRNDWQATWPSTVATFTATDRMLKDIADRNSYGADGKTYKVPDGYEKGSEDISSITLGADTKYSIAMMIGADYDDPAWEKLLSQLSIEDLAKFTRQGRLAIESVGLPATTAVDGPAAWTKSKYKEDYTKFGADVVATTEAMVAYPTETVFAGTWNLDILKKIGNSFGEEGLWGGGVGWYGPAANTHRTPYAGRNFEYYSEDGFIAGKMAEAEVHGAMAKGTIPYLKHFFLNDQETNRIGVCTFSNEQALREVYMRAYQYAFETTGKDDPSCSGVMGAFNRLGVVWSGHYTTLWKNVMATEWGFTGNVTTDFGQNPQGLMGPELAYEAGTTMFCTSGATFENIVVVNAKTDAKLLANMRESAHRTLYNFANSAAMNGLTSDTKIVSITPWYQSALTALTIASSVVALAGAAWIVVVYAKNKKED